MLNLYYTSTNTIERYNENIKLIKYIYLFQALLILYSWILRSVTIQRGSKCRTNACVCTTVANTDFKWIAEPKQNVKPIISAACI